MITLLNPPVVQPISPYKVNRQPEQPSTRPAPSINDQQIQSYHQRNARHLTPSELTVHLTKNNETHTDKPSNDQTDQWNLRRARSSEKNTNPPEESTTALKLELLAIEEKYSKQKEKLSEILFKHRTENQIIVSNDFSREDSPHSILENMEHVVKKLKSGELSFDPRYYTELDIISFKYYESAFKPTSTVTLQNIQEKEIAEIAQRSETAKKNPRLTQQDKDKIEKETQRQSEEIEKMITSTINYLDCFLVDTYKKDNLDQRYSTVKKEIVDIAKSYPWDIPEWLSETTIIPQCTNSTESPLERTSETPPYSLEPSGTGKEHTTVHTTTPKGDRVHGDQCKDTPNPFRDQDTPENNIEQLTSKFVSLQCNFSRDVTKLDKNGLKQLKKLCRKNEKKEFETLANRYITSLEKKAGKIIDELNKLTDEFNSWDEYDFHNTRIQSTRISQEQITLTSKTLEYNKNTIAEIPEKYHCMTSDEQRGEDNPAVFHSPDTPEVDMQTLTRKLTNLRRNFSEEVSKLQDEGLDKLKDLCQKSNQDKFEEIANNYKEKLDKKATKITRELDKLTREFRSWDIFSFHNVRAQNIRISQELKESVSSTLNENTLAINQIPKKNNCLLTSETKPTESENTVTASLSSIMPAASKYSEHKSKAEYTATQETQETQARSNKKTANDKVSVSDRLKKDISVKTSESYKASLVASNEKLPSLPSYATAKPGLITHNQNKKISSATENNPSSPTLDRHKRKFLDKVPLPDNLDSFNEDTYIREDKYSDIELKDDPNINFNTLFVYDSSISDNDKPILGKMRYAVKTCFRYANSYFRAFREIEEGVRELLKKQTISKRPLENDEADAIKEKLDTIKSYPLIAAQHYLASSNALDKLVTESVAELEEDIKATQNNPFLQQHSTLKKEIIKKIRLQQKAIDEQTKSYQDILGDFINNRIEKANSKIEKLEYRYTQIMSFELSGESVKNDNTNSAESVHDKRGKERQGTPGDRGKTSRADTAFSGEYTPETSDRVSVQTGIENSSPHIRQRRHDAMFQAAQSYDSIPSGSSSIHRGILPGLKKITEDAVLSGAAWLARSIMPSSFNNPSPPPLVPDFQTNSLPAPQVSALTERPAQLTFTARTEYTGHINDQNACEPFSVRIMVTDEHGESRVSPAMNQSPLNPIDNGSNAMTQKLVAISRDNWQQESQSLLNDDIHDLRLPYTRSESLSAMAERYARNHNGQLPPGFTKTEQGFDYTSQTVFTVTCDPQQNACTLDSAAPGYEDGVGGIIGHAHQEARTQYREEQASTFFESLPVTGSLELANVAASLLTKRKIIPSRTIDALHNASNPQGKADNYSPGISLARDSFAIARGLYSEISGFLEQVQKTDSFVSQRWSSDDILYMAIIIRAGLQPEQPRIELIMDFVSTVLHSPELGVNHTFTDNVFTLDNQGNTSIYGNASDSSLAFQRKNVMEPASGNACAAASCMFAASARDHLKQGQIDIPLIIETAQRLKARQQQSVISTIAKHFNPDLNEPLQQKEALEARLRQLIHYKVNSKVNNTLNNANHTFNCSIGSTELMGKLLRPDIDSQTVQQAKDLFFALAPDDQLICIEDLLKQPDLYWQGGSGALEQKVRSDLSNQQSGGESEERWQLFLYLVDTRVKVNDRINDHIKLMDVVYRQLGGSDKVLDESQQLAQYMAEHLPQPKTLYQQSIPEADRLLPVPFADRDTPPSHQPTSLLASAQNTNAKNSNGVAAMLDGYQTIKEEIISLYPCYFSDQGEPWKDTLISNMSLTCFDALVADILQQQLNGESKTAVIMKVLSQYRQEEDV